MWKGRSNQSLVMGGVCSNYTNAPSVGQIQLSSGHLLYTSKAGKSELFVVVVVVVLSTTAIPSRKWMCQVGVSEEGVCCKIIFL